MSLQQQRGVAEVAIIQINATKPQQLATMATLRIATILYADCLLNLDSTSLILDLAVVDHTIKKNPDDAGGTVTINY